MFTKEEVQFLLDSMHSHLLAHGLKAATPAAVILAKLQAAVGNQALAEELEVAAEKDT